MWNYHKHFNNELRVEYSQNHSLECVDISHEIKLSQLNTYFIKQYLKQLGPLKKLSKDKEINLILKFRAGDEEALQELILANQYIVIKEVIRVANHSLEIMDLIQYANLSLIESLTSNNADLKGLKSYLHRNIYRKLQNCINNNFSIIRYPQNKIIDLVAFNRYLIETDLINRFHLVKYDEEPFGLKINEAINELKKSTSSKHNILIPYLFMAYFRYDYFDYINNIFCNEMTDKDQFRISLKLEINNILNSLKAQERKVIKMYFGIELDYSYTLDEIGDEFNLTRERVRQIKEKALNRLKHRQRKKILNPYYYELLSTKNTPSFDLAVNGWLLDPFNAYENEIDDNILLLKEYIEPSVRKEFVPGIKNLTKHYKKLITSFLTEIGNITLSKKVIKHIKLIDDGMFNRSIYEYAIKTSENIRIVNDYIGLKKYFEKIRD